MQQSPANWTPDSEAPQCKNCKKDFGFFRHRHHCRQCGCVFCSDCSSKVSEMVRGYEGQGPQRICDRCEAHIQAKKIADERKADETFLRRQVEAILSRERKLIPCKYYWGEGNCAHGNACQYMHEASVSPPTRPQPAETFAEATPPPRTPVAVPAPVPPPKATTKCPPASLASQSSESLKRIPCQYFWNEVGCRDGESCPYMHDFPGTPTEPIKEEKSRAPTQRSSAGSSDPLLRLPTYGYVPCDRAREDADAATCQLCLENYAKGDTLMTLPCFHSFHQKCVMPWLLKSRKQGDTPTCPRCRSAVEPQTPVFGTT